MNPDLNLQSFTRNGDVSPEQPVGSTPPTTPGPSVPISIYRQLAHELQASQAEIEILKKQNSKLATQNQQLKQGAVQVFEMAHHLQTLIQSQSPREELPDLDSIPSHLPMATGSITTGSITTGSMPPGLGLAQDNSHPLSLEESEAEVLYRERPEQLDASVSSEQAVELSGWWLALSVILVVVSMFGMGFLFARPFLSNSDAN
jgi:hypothetical protein